MVHATVGLRLAAPRVAGTDSQGRMDHPKISSPQELNIRLMSRDRTRPPNPAIDVELQLATPRLNRTALVLGSSSGSRPGPVLRTATRGPRMTRQPMRPNHTAPSLVAAMDARGEPRTIRSASPQSLAPYSAPTSGPYRESASPPREIAGTDSHGRMDHPKAWSPQEVNARLTSQHRTGTPSPAIDLELQLPMPGPSRTASGRARA
jgi:hypothetical protein